MVNAYWAPNSRSILTESDFGIQLAVWSLTDSSTSIISNPKQPPVMPPSLSPTGSSSSSTAATGSNHSYAALAFRNHDSFSRLNSTVLGAPLACFSDCREYMAAVHRIEGHDHIGVYNVEPWGELNKFRARSSDISQVQWTPSSSLILAIDSPLLYRIGVYAPSTGELVASIEPYSNALGVRVASLHRAPLLLGGMSVGAESGFQYPLPPLQQLAAFGAYDGVVRLVSMASWKIAHVLPLVAPCDLPPGMAPATVVPSAAGATAAAAGAAGAGSDGNEAGEVGILPCQVEVAVGADGRKGASSAVTDRTVLGSVPSSSGRFSKGVGGQSGFVARELKTLPKRPTPAHSSAAGAKDSKGGAPSRGVCWMGWSGDGTLVAAREDSQPQCVWVWHALEARLSALMVNIDAITCARWRPLVAGAIKHTPLLAYVCNSPRVYFWSPTKGPHWTDLPPINTSIGIIAITFSADGSRLLLQGRESLCVLTLALEDGMQRQVLTDVTAAAINGSSSSSVAGSGSGLGLAAGGGGRTSNSNSNSNSGSNSGSGSRATFDMSVF